LKLDTPRLPAEFVYSTAGLAALIDALSSTDHVAIDAERASGFRYSQRAYLIQLAIRDKGIWLIDPVAQDMDLAELAEVLRPKTWLLHAATQDLPCLAELGITPSKLIDTELSARLCGLERVGLGSLCEALLEIELAKEHSAADWSQRPLSDAMVAYAALDVDVMFDLWDAISALLQQQNKLSWAQEEFDHLVGFKPKPLSPQPWMNLPGMSKVKEPAKIKIAASLWKTRDTEAKSRDIAPGRLIPDRSITAAVMQHPKTKNELAQNKEFNGRESRSKLNLWWSAIESAVDLEISTEPLDRSDSIPNHKSWERRFPEAHARLEQLRPRMVEKAEELGLPVENLLTPDFLRRVAFEPQSDIKQQLENLGARKWQIEIATEVIVRGLAAVEHPAV